MSAAGRAVASINLAAIERNTQRMLRELNGRASLCAVVKANGYGHGLVAAARAAMGGGAGMLAVACAAEARALRRAGLVEVPLLVMGALTDGERREALSVNAEVVIWREEQVEAVARAGGGRVHVKLDSGMGRLGTRDPEQATRVLRLARERAGVQPVGVMTHFATADDRSDEGFFASQLELFRNWVEQVRAGGEHLIAHAANSAATLRDPAAHLDMVRCGVALYGMDPFGSDPSAAGLEPALELRSYVAEVKRCAPGQSVGYGRRFIASGETEIAILPIGYGDGWRRALCGSGEVLISGRRRRLVGEVSMDNLAVVLSTAAESDPRHCCGPDLDVAKSSVASGRDSRRDELPGGELGEVARGTPAVLVGVEGQERITAEDVARWLGTINYEVTCALTSRVERRYHRDGQQLSEAGERDLAPGLEG